MFVTNCPTPNCPHWIVLGLFALEPITDAPLLNGTLPGVRNVIVCTIVVNVQLDISNLSLHDDNSRSYYKQIIVISSFGFCCLDIFWILLLWSLWCMVSGEWMDERISKAAHSLLLGSNVLYISSTDLESLTGPEAITRAIEQTFGPDIPPPKVTEVHFKVSSIGITLTDNKRRSAEFNLSYI